MAHSSAAALEKLAPLHEQVIDYIIANPWAKKSHIATHFGYSESWLHQLMGSDLFRSRLFERQAQFSAHNTVVASQRLNEIAEKALQRLNNMLEAGSADVEDTRKIAEMAMKGLSLGGFASNPRGPAPVVNVTGNAQFVTVQRNILEDARRGMLSLPQEKQVSDAAVELPPG